MKPYLINILWCHPCLTKKQLDEFKLVDYLAKKTTRIHKAMLISQGFNTETGDLETLIEHCELSKATDNIAVAKISASYEGSDTKRHKNCSKKFKENEENGKKHHEKILTLLLSLMWKYTSHL